jgi:hypothetical protein
LRYMWLKTVGSFSVKWHYPRKRPLETLIGHFGRGGHFAMGTLLGGRFCWPHAVREFCKGDAFGRRFRWAHSVRTFWSRRAFCKGDAFGRRFWRGILFGHFRRIGAYYRRTFLLMRRVGAFVVYMAICGTLSGGAFGGAFC